METARRGEPVDGRLISYLLSVSINFVTYKTLPSMLGKSRRLSLNKNCLYKHWIAQLRLYIYLAV